MNPRSLWNPGWSFGLLAAMLLLLALAAPVTAQEQPDQEATTITLDEIDDSGVSGIAMLSPNGDQTDVAIRLTGAFGDHPNHIHQNFCANANPEPQLPLTHIAVGEADPDGFTNSTVDIPLAELLGGAFSIIVHRSDDQLDEYVSCGNIGVAAEDEAAAVATEATAGGTDPASAETDQESAADTAAVSEMTTTGVGTGSQPDAGLPLIVATLAVLAAGVAVGTYRRARLG